MKLAEYSGLTKNYQITIRILKISSILNCILEIQPILEFHDLWTIPTTHNQKNIKVILSITVFVTACKITFDFINSFLRKSQILEFHDQRGHAHLWKDPPKNY